MKRISDYIVDEFNKQEVRFVDMQNGFKAYNIIAQTKELEKQMFIGMYLEIKLKNCKLEYGKEYLNKRDNLEEKAEKMYNKIFNK